MSSYGKYNPYRDQNSNTISENSVIFTETKFGVPENPGESGLPVEHPKQHVKTAEDVMLRSVKRLQNAMLPQVHGVKIVQAMWIIIYLGLTATFVVTFYDLIDKYTKHPTSMDFVIESGSNLEFPAVTVCNENPVKKSMIGRLRQYSDLLVLDDYVANYFNFSAREFETGGDQEDIDVGDMECPQPGLK